MGTRLSGTSSPPAPRTEGPPARGGAAQRTGPPVSPRRTPIVANRPAPAVPPDRDMRAKRPPAFSFLLRFSTLRRAGRIATLLALDFAGVSLAIFTALLLKEAVHGSVDTTNALHGTEQFLPFAYLLTALLFANSGLYSERALRPGLTRIVGSLFEVALVALIFAVVNGEHFSSYYLFYGSLVFAIFYVSAFRGVYDRLTLMAAPRGRLSPPRRARRPRPPDRRRRACARRRAPLADRGRRLPLADTAPGQRPASRSGRSRTSKRCSRPRASTR